MSIHSNFFKYFFYYEVDRPQRHAKKGEMEGGDLHAQQHILFDLHANCSFFTHMN